MTRKHVILFYILIANVYVFANVKPHIILIIGDDLGWNDVGFHGSNEIPTPNIDALAYNGLILNRHYVQPTCTPSRAALMTGKYPIRLGMQGPPLEPTSPTGLPLNERIWPEYFKKLGYVSRLVGKWHLGYYKYQFTPTKRGFDSHFGYYNGWIRYNDTILTTTKNQWGFDARMNLEHAGDRFKGKYATDVFTEEAVEIIKNHDVSKPLFLDVSQVAVHACAKNFLQVRNKEENDKKFSYIKDPERRLFAGVLTALDESVGKIIVALDEKNMLKNSIVLMMADNGGATKDTGFGYGNTGSNWPLRGWKASVTEGGVRGAAAIWSPLIPKNAVSYELLHICDWLPTFYAAAGGNVNELEDIDGVNQWEYLTNKQTTSSRHEVLLNINELKNDSALIFNEWKYIQINYASIDYAGSDGRNANLSYSINEIINTETHKILSKFTQNNENPEDLFNKLRTSATIDENCRERIEVVRNSDYTSKLRCFETGCLFHLKNDPCEFTDLSENESKLLEQLKEKMKFYREQLVPQITAKSDPNSNPALWDNYWSPWILDNDYSSSSIPICYKLILIFVVASVFFRFQMRF